MGQLDTSYTPVKQADPKPAPASAAVARPAPIAQPIITDYASI